MKKTGKRAVRKVPCNGCTLCCHKDAIRLLPEDTVSLYNTEPHPYIPGGVMLAHKPNGECVYLRENGCSIHDTAPVLCRSADCRTIALRYDFETARSFHVLGMLDLRVWDQGKKLLDTTKHTER